MFGSKKNTEPTQHAVKRFEESYVENVRHKSCPDIQDGKKKVRRPTQLFGHLGDTFTAYFLGLPTTRVESFYFSSYPIGAAEKHAFSMFGRTLVSLLPTLRSPRVVSMSTGVLDPLSCCLVSAYASIYVIWFKVSILKGPKHRQR
jgi:hypothetical protein